MASTIMTTGVRVAGMWRTFGAPAGAAIAAAIAAPRKRHAIAAGTTAASVYRSSI